MIANPRVDIALDFAAQLGEGPCWDPTRGELLWVDLLRDEIHRSDVGAGTTTTTAVDRTVGAAVLGHDGRVLAAVPGGFADVADDGVVSMIAPVDEPAGNRMNDGKCAPDGSFWAGSMARDNAAGAGTLYRLDPDHSVSTMLGDLTVSNGIGWSPDGDIVYFVDTPTQRIDRFRLDGPTRITDRTSFFEVDAGRGMPDGLCVDAEGNVWVALCFGGVVLCVSPEGREIAEIRVPAELTTSVAFGGDGLDVLFITTGRTGLGAQQLQKQPHAGSVFACRPGVAGQPAAVYMG